MPDTTPIITLMTDFGEQDTYVGAMKGVILSICPEAKMIDLTHRIPAQDICAAALQLSNVYAHFPPQTIHLIVVDPGVGSQRRAIICQVENHTFVCPDNGLLTLVVQQAPIEACVAIQNKTYFLPQVSHTFHGRDIFAPVAAHLANGIPMSEFGRPVTDLRYLQLAKLDISESQIKGEIIWIDHFGNAITNIGHQYLQMIDPELKLQINFRDQQISRLSESYSAVPVGTTLALISSFDYLEIAVNQGSASQICNLSLGDSVLVQPIAATTATSR